MTPDFPLRLALFPLPGVVHFPGTELRLHVFETRYRQLVRDLVELDAEERLIGVVLLRRTADAVGTASAGTAGLLTDVDLLADGRSFIRLHGSFRFRIERELAGRPYPQGWVRRFDDRAVDEEATEIRALRGRLERSVEQVATETGDRFPIPPERLLGLRGQPFETLVNSLAADLDLPAPSKQRLLERPPTARARALLSILESRQQVLDQLRPFRRLVGDPAHN